MVILFNIVFVVFFFCLIEFIVKFVNYDKMKNNRKKLNGNVKLEIIDEEFLNRFLLLGDILNGVEVN